MDRRPALAILALALACGAPQASRRGGRSLSTGALSYAAAVSGELVVAAELRTRFELVAYDSAGGTETWRRDIGPADYDLRAVAAAGDHIWVASTDGVVRSFAREDGRPALAWALGAAATSVVISADASFLVTATDRGVVCIRRLPDGALLQCLVAHEGAITDLAVSGKLLASSSTDGSVKLWTLPTLSLRAQTRLKGAANAVAISPTGDIAIARHDRPLTRTPEIARAEERGFPALDREALIVLWSPTKKRSRVLAGHRSAVTDLAFSSADELLSSSWDRTVRRWSLRTGTSTVIAKFPYLVRSLAGSGQLWIACVWGPKPGQPATQVLVNTAPAAIDEE